MVEYDLDNFSEDMKLEAKKTHQIWKEFLLGERPHPSGNEQHFLPLDSFEKHTFDDMPTNINRYILRSVDVDAVTGEKSAFIYAKLERFVIIGFILMPSPRQWDGTKVNANHGFVRPTNYTIPDKFGTYFFDKAREASAVQKKISDKQQDKITETFKKNIDKMSTSETFRAMSEDVRLFGKKAFDKTGKGE